MIKFFWNSHNQEKPNSEHKKIREKQENDNQWGKYHKKSSKDWIYEILKKVKYQVIDSELELKKEDTLIIVDSSIEEKTEFYSKLNLICSKIFLFHLGDETGSHDLLSVYKNCTYIWRTFCLSKYFESNKVKCIPIGYKSGVLNENIGKPGLDFSDYRKFHSLKQSRFYHRDRGEELKIQTWNGVYE